MDYYRERYTYALTLLALFLAIYLILLDPLTAYVSKETLSGAIEHKAATDSAEEFIKNFEDIAVPVPKDVTPPLILASSSVSVEVGAKSVPGPLMCVDDVDKNVECNIVGNYDLNRIGTYRLKRIATDSAGNTIEFPFVLNVVKELGNFSEETKDEPLKFEDAISLYKTSNTMVGIDVSKWQGTIDWKQVAKSGVEFAILRIGIQDGFGGDCVLDEQFVRNFREAKAAGLLVGIYLYSYSTSLIDSFNQGVFVLQTLKDYGYKPDFPIVYDWESWSRFGSLGMSLNDLNDCARIFFDVLKTEGYEGCLYSSKYYLENNVWNITDYPVWLANYTKQTTYAGDYFMWQCSNTGRVSGISGDVDVDVYYIGNK